MAHREGVPRTTWKSADSLPPHASSNASRKEASPRVVECCRWPKVAHREGVPRTRPGSLRTACLPTRRRMLSGGPPAPLGWAGSENPGVRPLFKKGLPHAPPNAVGWLGKSWVRPPHASSKCPKWLIVKGGLQDEASNRDFPCFCVVLRAFLEPGRSVSCKNGLPPAQKDTLPEKPRARRLKRGLATRRRMLSDGPKWLIVRGSPGRGSKSRFSGFLRGLWSFRTACLPTRRRVLSGGLTWLVVTGSQKAWQKHFVRAAPRVRRDARWSAPRVEGILSEPAAT